MNRFSEHAHLILGVLMCGVVIFPAIGSPVTTGPGSEGPAMVRKLATIEFEPVREMSGIARSHRFDDVYWVHNDSGDTARLFAVNERGKVIFPAFLKRIYYGETIEPGKREWPGLRVAIAANLDWEDIAVDDDMIYIAETGNNGNARRDLGVYVIPEPNPRAVDRTRILKFVPIQYPDQESFPAREWHFDAEALFVVSGKLYFLTKHRKAGTMGEWEPGTHLYRLDSMKTDDFNILKRVDGNDHVDVVTGADLSPDGKHLAVVCYTQLWVFDRPRWRDKWLSTHSRMISLDFDDTGAVEAVTWRDNATMVIGNEAGDLFVVDLDDLPP